MSRLENYDHYYKNSIAITIRPIGTSVTICLYAALAHQAKTQCID